MTVIKFATLDIPVDLVERSIVVLQQVQFLNRNRNDAHLPLLVVTDCDREVRKHVVVNHKTADQYFSKFLGLTFHRNDGQAVWLSPRGCSSADTTWFDYDLTKISHRKNVVETIVHEFAHVVVGRQRGHGWGFRRAYTLLVDLVGNDVFSEWVTCTPNHEAFDVWAAVLRVIERYQRTGEYERPATGSYAEGTTWSWPSLRRREELDKHMAALARMRKRITKIHSAL